MVKPALDTFRLLLDLCEHPEPLITGKVLRENYGASAQALLAAGTLKAGPNLSHVQIAIDDDEEIEVEIERDPKSGAPGYVSPRTGRWRTLPESDLMQYRLHVDHILSLLKDALEVPERFATIELVPGLLWEIGEAHLGKRAAIVLFARRLTVPAHIDQISDALTNRTGKADGLLLSSTVHIPRHLVVPGQHRIVSLHQCLDTNSSVFALDQAVLNGRLSGAGPVRALVAVECTPDGSLLTIHGKDYPFKGPKQKAIIRLLYGAWKDGRAKQKTAEVLRKAGSNADQLAHAFGGSPSAWKEVVGYGEGYCWLKTE